MIGTHQPAKRLLEQLAHGDRPWAWPCVYEFLR